MRSILPLVTLLALLANLGSVNGARGNCFRPRFGLQRQPTVNKPLPAARPRTTVVRNSIDPFNNALLARGGSDASISFDLALLSESLLYLFAAFNAFHGVVLGVAPKLGRQLLGTAVDENDKCAVYAEEAVGCFAIEYGLTGFLAASELVTPELAIGYGTIPDLYFMGKNLLNGKFEEFGVQKTLSVLTLITATSTYAILADKIHLGPVLEILTVVPAIQGVMKYFDPVGSAKIMLKSDISDSPVAKALYRTSGQMKLVSAFLRGALAFGVEPLKALGYSVFFNAALIVDSTFLKKTSSDFGTDKALPHQLGALALALVMGVSFVLNSD